MQPAVCSCLWGLQDCQHCVSMLVCTAFVWQCLANACMSSSLCSVSAHDKRLAGKVCMHLLVPGPRLQLTQVLCSAAKLVWRSTTNLRDIWAERLLRWDFTFAYPPDESLAQNRLVAVGIQTEMILENASNILAPWVIWCTWHVPLFMSIAPDLLVKGGEYPMYCVLGLITALISVRAFKHLQTDTHVHTMYWSCLQRMVGGTCMHTRTHTHEHPEAHTLSDPMTHT